MFVSTASEMRASNDGNEIGRTGDSASALPSARPKINLLMNSEERVLTAGVALLIVYAIWLGYRIVVQHEEPHVLIGVSVLTALAGHAVGIGLGISARLSPPRF